MKSKRKLTAVATMATIAFGTSRITTVCPSWDGKRSWFREASGAGPEKKRSRIIEIRIELRYGRAREGRAPRRLLYKWYISDEEA